MNDKFSPAETAAIARLETGIECGTVLPVVGAGVSAQGANLPRWNSLLAAAIEWTHEQENLRLSEEGLKTLASLNLENPTPACYETWVKTVFCRNHGDSHWTAPEYREWLQATFGDCEVVDKELYEALGAMDARVIATTNYDVLLTNELMREDEVVTWSDDEKIRDLLREKRGVLHLHGVFDNPESVILTTGDYERLTQTHMRSEVARTLAFNKILLFIGVSPEGVTDRHLGELLRVSLSGNGPRPQSRPHVLLHRGPLKSRHAAILTELGIQGIRFGDDYAELGPFLKRLSRLRSDLRNAMDLVGLDRRAGETLSDSRWAPQQCLDRVQSSLRFMGLRSSKWVSDDAFDALDERLKFLDSKPGEGRIRFLILNPECYGRLEGMRNDELSADHLEDLAKLERDHESLEVRCVDFISAFRFTAVDGKEIGLALYPTTPDEFKETDKGWSVRHHSLSTQRPWSLARSLVFMFDEQFHQAQSLRKIKPELFA